MPQLDEETRAVRKKAQLARLAKKGTPEYPALYAAQPEQRRIALEQGAARLAAREAKQALGNAMRKQANEAVEVFGAADGNMEVE